jgi:hypothetical protein
LVSLESKLSAWEVIPDWRSKGLRRVRGIGNPKQRSVVLVNALDKDPILLRPLRSKLIDYNIFL